MSNAAANRVVEVTTNDTLEGIGMVNGITVAASGGAASVEIWGSFAPGQTAVRIATIQAPSAETTHIPFYCTGILNLETRAISNARVYIHFA